MPCGFPVVVRAPTAFPDHREGRSDEQGDGNDQQPPLGREVAHHGDPEGQENQQWDSKGGPGTESLQRAAAVRTTEGTHAGRPSSVCRLSDSVTMRPGVSGSSNSRRNRALIEASAGRASSQAESRRWPST